MGKEKPILEWDEYEIVEAEVKHRLKNPEEFDLEEDNSNEDMIRRNLYEGFFLQDEWDFLTEALSEILNKINPSGYWKANVENFGWRNLNGNKRFYADKGSEFLREILPKTDCTFRIFEYEEGELKGLKIQNFHHDSPMGNEWYYILPEEEA